jgi:short-subunit dehydrogenase
MAIYFMNYFKNRLGVISGATGFLGSILARHYSNLDSDLILIGRDGEKLNLLKEEIASNSSREIICVALDFESDYISKLHGEIEQHSHRINYFINAIGDQKPISPILLSDDDDWAKSIETNLIVPVNLTKFFVKKFIDNGSGSVILTSGGGASTPRRNFSAYASAKTGLVRFVETFASEISATQVQINAVAPGILPSKMMNEVLENFTIAGEEESAKARSTLDRADEWKPNKVLALCDFLLSRKSQGITGKLISADWDNWSEWRQHIMKINNSDIYTLRRITSRNCGHNWDDNLC